MRSVVVLFSKSLTFVCLILILDFYYNYDIKAYREIVHANINDLFFKCHYN
jgi:alpha-N-acetylglucosamine transferase